MDTLIRDVRYAIGTLRRSPSFSLLAILTIAVGIGATSGVFSVINAVLVRPLPFERADDLVLISQVDKRTRQGVGDASPANFLDWRARSHAFAGMSAMRSAALALSTTDRPEPVDGAMVSANFFQVLGVKPLLGRVFEQEDERPGAPRVAILGHDLWRQRFGGGSEIIGQPVRINDETYTIVGVMPTRIAYPDNAQLWVPPHWPVPDDPLLPAEDPSAQRGHGYIRVLARVKPGVSRGAAQTDLDSVAAALEQEYPNDNSDVGIHLVSLRDDLVGDVRPTLMLLSGAVGLLLILSTVNVSGLLIARASARHQEMAVRAALGASRYRIVTQLLIESLLLAVTGGAAGVLLATWIIGPLVAISPSNLGLLDEVRVDSRVLLFGLVASMAAGLSFGLAPARQLLRLNLQDDLKQTSRGATAPHQRRLRAALVTAEIAVSLVLLVGAGLTIRSLVRLQQVPAGFQTDHVLTVRVDLAPRRYPTASSKAAFWDAARERLRRLPGVEAVGATTRLPLVPGNSTRSVLIDANRSGGADYRAVTPGYFSAIGIPVLRGRVPDDTDHERHPRVAAISASMAAHFWPNQDAVGQRFVFGASPTDPSITIVGVVGDIHHRSLDAAPIPTIYVPYRQDPWASMTFAIRAVGDPAAISAAARQAIWQVDKDQPIRSVSTMDERLSASLSGRRFSAMLLSIFGVLAIAVASIGLYGVVAFLVTQQRREIGLRMALGASRNRVMADVITHGVTLACVGVGTGLVLAVIAARRFATMLYDVSPTDTVTFAAVAVLMVLIAAGASAAPAWRASRVDPLNALREG
jgi:putative ABC transport system permease protein